MRRRQEDRQPGISCTSSFPSQVGVLQSRKRRRIRLTSRIAGIVNSIFVFVTFAATIPAITMPTRGWLKVSGYMATITALFSVIVGLYLWILTLKSKETLAPLWQAATAQTQELMQTEVCYPSPIYC